MISAIVLAAGQSIRMGQPKMTLPWGDKTVIATIISTILKTDIDNILVITGGTYSSVQNALNEYPVEFVFNPKFEDGEMLSSVQVGLKNLRQSVQAALIVLGDQPQIDAMIIRKIVENYRTSDHKIIVPSYQMRRGHPWLIDRCFWYEIAELKQPKTLRNFLNLNKEKIAYINVDSPSVLQDLDTPEDYAAGEPGNR